MARPSSSTSSPVTTKPLAGSSATSAMWMTAPEPTTRTSRWRRLGEPVSRACRGADVRPVASVRRTKPRYRRLPSPFLKSRTLTTGVFWAAKEPVATSQIDRDRNTCGFKVPSCARANAGQATDQGPLRMTPDRPVRRVSDVQRAVGISGKAAGNPISASAAGPSIEPSDRKTQSVPARSWGRCPSARTRKLALSEKARSFRQAILLATRCGPVPRPS
jgi:hypothetical protein